MTDVFRTKKKVIIYLLVLRMIICLHFDVRWEQFSFYQSFMWYSFGKTQENPLVTNGKTLKTLFIIVFPFFIKFFSRITQKLFFSLHNYIQRNTQISIETIEHFFFLMT